MRNRSAFRLVSGNERCQRMGTFSKSAAGKGLNRCLFTFVSSFVLNISFHWAASSSPNWITLFADTFAGNHNRRFWKSNLWTNQCHDCLILLYHICKRLRPMFTRSEATWTSLLFRSGRDQTFEKSKLWNNFWWFCVSKQFGELKMSLEHVLEPFWCILTIKTL